MAVPTPSVDGPLNVLPKDAAEELKEYARNEGKRCVRELRLRGESETDSVSDVEHRFSSFTNRCEGFLSETTCENIKLLLTSASKYTANLKKRKRTKFPPWTRAKYARAADSQKDNMENHYKSLTSGGNQEISEQLAKNIKMMGQAAASLAFLSSFGSREEKNQKERELNGLFELIQGDVKIIDMKFIVDKAKIISKRPVVVSEKKMENETDVAQTMKFSFAVTEGKTRSATHTVNFNCGIGASFTAGFPGIGEINCQLSFDFSHDHSFQECINKTITKSYEFDLLVPAHRTQVARATVNEAKLEVPYELVLDLNGSRKPVIGLWKGVACTEATYTVEEVLEGSKWRLISFFIVFIVCIFVYLFY